MEKPLNIGGVGGNTTQIKDTGEQSKKENAGKVPTNIEDLLKEKVNESDVTPTLIKNNNNSVDTNHFAKLLSHISVWGATA